MAITGSFINKDNEKISLNINCDTGADDIVLGETPGYFFSGKKPITIELKNDDSFQQYAELQCKIKLITPKYIPELYSPKDREIGVTVQKIVEKEVETVVNFFIPHQDEMPVIPTTAITYFKTTEESPYYEMSGIVINDINTEPIAHSFTSEGLLLPCVYGADYPQNARYWIYLDSPTGSFKSGDKISITAKNAGGEYNYIDIDLYVNGTGTKLDEFIVEENADVFHTHTYTLTNDYSSLLIIPNVGATENFIISNITVTREDLTVYNITKTSSDYRIADTGLAIFYAAGTSNCVVYTSPQTKNEIFAGNVIYNGLTADNALILRRKNGSFYKGDILTLWGFTNTTDTSLNSRIIAFYMNGNTPSSLGVTDVLQVMSEDEDYIKSYSITLPVDIPNGVIYFGQTGTNTGYGAVITAVTVTHDPTTITTLFTGYVEPQTYDLPYALKMTEISINCQDYLSTLENHKYKENDIDLYGYSYVLSNATNITINSIFTNLGLTLSDTDKARFDNFKISELMLIGSTEDDVLGCDELLEDLCDYFNIHAISSNDPDDPTAITLFDYNEKILDASVDFGDYVASNDTKFSYAEVYNSFKLKVDVKDEETIINSPFDDDSLTSPFTNKQHYNDTFMSWGQGGDSQGAFKNIIKENNSDYDSWSKKSYFLQVYKSNLWSFNTDDYVDSLNGKNQWKVPQYLHDNRFKCAMFSVGSIDNHIEGKDDSAVTNIDMSNYLYISVNGTADQSYTYYPWYGTSALWGTGYYPYNQPNTSPSKSDIDSFISGGGWLAKYNGNDNGGIIGSTDNAAINYIVFSGKIIMKPKYHIMPSLSGQAWLGSDATIYDKLYKMMANGQKFKGSSGTNGFYTVRFLENETPTSSDKIREPGTDLTKANMQFYNSDFTFENDDGYDDDVWGLTKYKGNSDTGNNDTIPKVPVLLCEMTVGDYFLMETELGTYKWYKDNGDGTYLVWLGATWGTTSSKPYNFLSDLSSTTKVYDYKHVFSIGFNPAVGDKVFAKEYSFANNISYTMNLDDAEGIGIVLPTGLSGKISFKILAPCCTIWNGEVCTRQPGTFHHSEWANRTCEILPFTESIIVKDFKCELYSDNAGVNNYTEQDLIYMTGDTITKGSVGVKDDLDFAFSTALTSEQALEKGQSPGAKLSNMIYNDLPFTGYDSSIDDKPEIRYLTDKYNEFYTPRVIISSTLKGAPEFFRNYKMKDPEATFMPMSYKYDAKENKTQYNLKETW